MNLAEIKYKNNKIATLTDTVPEIVLNTSGTYLDGDVETGIVVPEYDGSYFPPCLCFTANTAGSTISMGVSGTPEFNQNFQTSVNGKNWTEFVPGTTTITLSNVGDKIYFKGNNPNGINYDDDTYYYAAVFEMTGSIFASGNIMSLIDNGKCTCTTVPNDACFQRMFSWCEALITAPNLPATSLTKLCYKFMFGDCTSLISAPKLPALILADGCYGGMFYNCTSLTTAPALPAITLANDCYLWMFQSCTSLTTIPKLPAIVLDSYCYDSMFLDCSSLQVSDTQTSAAPYVWRIPDSSIFTCTYSQEYMFQGCAGTRASDNMPGVSGQSYTYYTQNPPV